MKVRRVLEYEGDEEWIVRTLECSYVKRHPQSVGDGRSIREVSVETLDPVTELWGPNPFGGEDMMETKEARAT